MLNTEVTPDLGEKIRPDVLIAAVGAEPIIPKIPGVNGKNVVVAGCGPIGLMAIAVLKVYGAKRVIATELASEKIRFSLARKMGADEVLDAAMGTDALVNEVKGLTDGNGADVCLEMSGAAQALKQVIEMLTPGGRVSILGLYGDPVTLDVNNPITFKSATVHGITGRRMFQTWDQMFSCILAPEDWDTWLDPMPSTDEMLLPLLKPFCAGSDAAMSNITG